MHYPVHRSNWMTVAGIVLAGVPLITVVLGRAARAKKRALGKNGLTNMIVG
jgi:hypothetical protein